MDREQVIALLAQAEGYLSGEEMSRALGVTRAAVWKEITALREQGWKIESAPRQGYRLAGEAPGLSGAYISAMLEPDSLFAGKVLALDSVDSTNTRLKAMAAQGAQTGTVLLAEEQTGGRGTRGRPFLSPRGEGLYLSVLLRPDAALSDLLTLTGWVAVAVRAGIQAACGAPAEIKWLNDIYLNGRKLVGVLTELSLMGESSEVDYVVVGIGVNVSQSGETFQAQGLEKIATSLAAEGWSVERNRLAAAILNELDKLCRAFPREREGYLTEYRRHCLTLGRAVAFEEQGQARTGVAREVDGQFGLVIDGGDGQSYTVTSGTVTLV
jgi:BirA family biotin operon repressor/biotin-[acetyl-CoA-carboxylase] ligase